ncbi:MAG: tetratricopeptide repeat protein [Muribaculaceae bacterium]|nr:tetratricopeptide repeat protein [Muribaculaceae bacterium]MDY3933694.1 tetratricopeptide repeat protein [Muribaculaceae bacterium]
MANNKKDVHTSIDELNETLTSVEQHVENNKKIIIWSLAGIVAVAAVILLYYYGIYAPNKKASSDAISKADIELAMGNDSTALAQYMQVADEFSGAQADRAALQSAIILYQKGKFEEAVKYLDDASFDENLVAPAAASLKGDCYVNLNNLDKAISCYDKAIKSSNDNALYTPLFMLKKATVLNEQSKIADALAIYEAIQSKYPTFTRAYDVNIDGLIARAKAQLAE